MARKKPLTINEIEALAERVQDLAIEVAHASERVDIMQPEIASAAAVAKFHQMTTASAEMTRMLIVILSHREDIERMERDLRAKIAATA